MSPPPPVSPRTVESLTSLVMSLKQAWRSGTRPDVGSALRDHPDLLSYRSLVIDLAYEEYCLHEEAGRTPDADSFCKVLPAYRSYLREVIRGHRLLADHPEVLATTSTDWPHPGDVIAGIRIVRELGRGAFARVYLGQDPGTGDRPVVLKLSPHPSAEGRTLGTVSHPHVVGVFWARQVDGHFAVCMPYVGSTTLRDLLDQAFVPGGAPPRDCRYLANTLEADNADALVSPDAPPAPFRRQTPYPTAVAALTVRLAGALAYLHSLGLAHGDLKPSNILLDRTGKPYLIDFNLAGFTEDTLWRCGGTLPYMAPERLRLVAGQRRTASRGDQSDVYSFGVVLFESLTGRLPFPPVGSGDIRAVATDLLCQQSRHGLPDRLTGMPRPLARLVRNCLAVDPDARPSAARIQRVLLGYEARWRRRVRRVALVGSLLLLGLGTWLLFQRPPPPRPPATADEYLDRGRQFLRSGDVAAATADIDAAARTQRNGRTTAFQAYVRTRAGQHRDAIPLYREAIARDFAPAWVHNNLAYSLTQTERAPPALQEALRSIDQARILDPSSRAVRFNWAYTRFLVRCGTNCRVYQDSEGRADLDRVMAAGPYDADLCYKAGLMYAAGSQSDADRVRAVFWLVRAVELGRPAVTLRNNPLLVHHLGGRDDFRALLDLPNPSTVPAPLNLQLLHPLD